MSMLHRLAILCLTVNLAAASTAVAGTIEVVVRHRDGWPIIDQDVHLIPLSVYREAAHKSRPPSPIYEVGTTDAEGRILFSDVPAGTYTVHIIGHFHDPLLVKPSHNPLAPAPIAVLDADDDTHRMEIEIWSGVEVRLELVGLEGLPPDGFLAAFHHPETGVPVWRRSFSEPVLEVLLVPTVWEISVRPEQGFEPVSLEYAGELLDTHEACVDLEASPSETDLRFTFRSSPVVPKRGVRVRDHVDSDAPLQIRVRRDSGRHGYARVEIFSRVDPSEPVRRTTVSGHRGVGISDLPPGDYLVVAGSPHTLEGHAELRDFDAEAGARTVVIELPRGAAIRIQALDAGDRPVADLDVEIERLDDDPELLLHDEHFRQAKRRRSGSADNRGWFEATGFYPGRYILRAGLRRARAADFEVLLGLKGSELTADSELELELGSEPVAIEVRVLPRAR